MNEEEALEIFKNLILLPSNWLITDKYKGTLDFIGSLEGNEAIQTILNLIEKLSKENEQLRTEMNSLQKENKELNKKLILQKGIGDYWCESYMELQKEMERKK